MTEGGGAAPAVEGVLVAVPARNEEGRLPAALRAIGRAARSCPLPVAVVVAADSCTDATAAVARAHGVHVTSVAHAAVGPARTAAVAAGLALLGLDPRTVWIANTDADSVVPHDWLAVHLAFAERGVGLLRGSVRPHARELAVGPRLRWAMLNPPAEQHEHVHGANLGVRADVYLAAGGFPMVAHDEDVGLVRAVVAQGHVTRSTDLAPVVTSGRLVGRTDHGFAAYLRRIAAAEAVRAPGGK